MADYIESIDSNTTYGQSTGIYLKRVLTGNVESVRSRLAVALEEVGYDIFEDEPAVQGRRDARGWGKWGGSGDVLDYTTTLTVRLKSVSANSTRATFDYVINHPWLSGGEKEVLVREAETIVALATERRADKICGACGTESVDDSRFCRRCGTPLTREQAELDVLRMTAESRAAHSSVVTTWIMLAVTTAILLALMIAVSAGANIKPKAFWAFAIICATINLANLFFTSCAWTRLNRALKMKPKQTSSLSPGNMANAAALPPHETIASTPLQQGWTSVTEGTTELLRVQLNEPVEHARLERKTKDTDSVN